MPWLHLVSYFVGGAFFTNAIPHLVSGVLGRPFQSPFAKPPGRGLSSSIVNALWGWLNLVIGCGLVCRVGVFDIHDNLDMLSLATGSLVMAVLTAWNFGKLHGGNRPLDSDPSA